MKIALVHDWLLSLGGAERVLIELHKIFPDAPIFTLFYNKKFTNELIPEAEIRGSRMNNLPLIKKIYKYLFFVMPSAIESFDFSDFDIVISSSVTFSKGIVLKPKTKHICYCYSPSRFLWDRNADYKTGFLGKFASHYLRVWDRQASDRVDEFIAISKNIQRRIKKYYSRESKVIYPPCSIVNGVYSQDGIKNRDFFLIISRLFDYKNIDVAITAFNKLHLPLVIIGDGPEKEHLKKIAENNIEFIGKIDDEKIVYYYRNCKALIMPQEEDFGLTAVEAMSFGKPVLALRKGGAIESVIEGICGEFFDDPIPEAIADGVRRLNENYKLYSPLVIKKYAEKFSIDRFRDEILSLVSKYKN